MKKNDSDIYFFFPLISITEFSEEIEISSCLNEIYADNEITVEVFMQQYYIHTPKKKENRRGNKRQL